MDSPPHCLCQRILGAILGGQGFVLSTCARRHSHAVADQPPRRKLRHFILSCACLLLPHWFFFFCMLCCDTAMVADDMTAEQFLEYLEKCESGYPEYQALLERGLSREQARIGLPLNTYTEVFFFPQFSRLSCVNLTKHNSGTGALTCTTLCTFCRCAWTHMPRRKSATMR